MSTLRLTKDHPKYGKAKAVVTVPFLEARDLVSRGDAERWNGGATGGKAPESPATVSTAAFEKAGKRIGELEAEVNALQQDNDEHAAELKKAIDRAAKLEAENRRLADELAAVKKAAGK